MSNHDDIEQRFTATQLVLAQAERAALGARIDLDRISLGAAQRMMPGADVADEDGVSFATLFQGMKEAFQLVADAHKTVADLYAEAEKLGADMDEFLND